MPIPAQGFTITWGGARLYDVQELTITPPQPGDTDLGRDGQPPIDGGTIRLLSLEPVERPRSGRPFGRGAIAVRLTVKCMGAVVGGRNPDDDLSFSPIARALPALPPVTGVANTSRLRVLTLIDHICRYDGGNISATRNDVLRFDHNFTILTVAEPS
jgi:hypothetical protein